MYVTNRNGKLRLWERVTIDGKVHKLSIKLDRDTPQARKKAAAILEERISRLVPSSTVTVFDLCERYLEDLDTRLKKSSMRTRRIELDIICRHIGRKKVSDLTAGLIRSTLLEITRNPNTLNEYRTRMKALIHWAYQNDYIESTSCIDKIKPWTVPQKINEFKYLEKNELAAVISAADPFHAALIEFLALTGLRVGELIALNKDDVTDTEITVTKTYDSANQITTSAKTATSVRKVYAQPELLPVIIKIRQMSDRHRMATGSRLPLFVVTSRGNRLSYQSFALYFQRLTKNVLGRRLTLHALRHTHTSLLAEAGLPLASISRRLGHQGSQVTESVYLHVTQKLEERDRELIRNVSILDEKSKQGVNTSAVASIK